LQFYFKAVAGIRETDEVEETVDARLFGNIFHKAAEKIYKPFFNSNTLIDTDLLNNILKEKNNIHKVINKAFAETFYGENTSKEFKTEGKNRIVFDVLEKYLIKLIKKDIEYAPFSIVGLEKNVSSEIEFTVNNTQLIAEIGGQIDRIDRTNRFLRIIDYKTGNDELKFKNLEDVFDKEKIKKHKAVFQTFLYSYVVNKVNYPNETILPMVYQVKKLFSSKSNFEIISSECQEFINEKFSGIKTEVESYIKELLSELFNKDIPFFQTENTDNCKYCNYKNICGR
jgi:ATP-dependent helicase/DNAse subunit B